MTETSNIHMFLTSGIREQIGCWRNRVLFGHFRAPIRIGFQHTRKIHRSPKTVISMHKFRALRRSYLCVRLEKSRVDWRPAGWDIAPYSFQLISCLRDLHKRPSNRFACMCKPTFSNRRVLPSYTKEKEQTAGRRSNLHSGHLCP
jgi:hypothetical protein